MFSRVVLLHFPPLFPSPSPNYAVPPPCLSFCVISHFPHPPSLYLLSLIPATFPLCLSAPRYILSPTIFFPFTPSASDCARHALSTWLKSSGPTGGGQTVALFPLTEASVCLQWKLMTFMHCVCSALIHILKHWSPLT